MFKRREDGKMVCVIHPDVQGQRGAITIKGKSRMVEVCPECEKLVQELKTLKAPIDRHLKGN